MIGSGGGRWDAPLKSTVRAQNTIKLNCAMNDSFFLFIFFIADFFFCLTLRFHSGELSAAGIPSRGHCQKNQVSLLSSKFGCSAALI